MNRIDRRQWLQRMLAGGAWGAAGMSGFLSEALAKGDLPATPGVNRLDGTATVNGQPAKVGTPVGLGDKVSTGTGSQAVIVVQGDAFLLRSQTTIELRGRDGVLDRLLIATGRVLSVFSKKPLSVQAAHATIGIRGTGAYIEVDPGSVYFCLCYGEAIVEGAGMAPRDVKTTHHEEPLLVNEVGGTVGIVPGPFRNHTDAELVMLESLVGREPPFMKSGQYPSQRY
jgi:hypothetical protein